MWLLLSIIVLAVALAVGPVMWLSPSPRDKRMAQYRARAVQLGMQVSLVNRSQLGIGVQMPKDQESVTFYRLPWNSNNPDEKQLLRHETFADWCLVKNKMTHEVYFAGRWEWLSKPPFARQSLPRLREFVKGLPDDYIACDSRRQGVGLAWLERGDVTQVDDVLQRLKALKAACIADLGTAANAAPASVKDQ